MNDKDLHSFSSDRPIKTAEDDLFDRAKFAKGIAHALSSWHGKDSLVVALYGEWGSGKSSIKNMAISELEKTEDTPDIIEFSPWEWAAQDKITAAFFQEISTALGQKKEGKKLAAIFKKYSEYLSTGKLIIDEFNSSILPSIYVLLPFLSAAGIFADEGIYKTISVALLTTIGIASAFINWGKLFSEKTGTPNESSLSELKNELTSLLSKRKKSLLVIMDDLDRLTSEQLHMVFQLVKANTEFPNVVFLLLFQRDLVEEKLNDGKQTGRNYLEKIIQVPFNIPKIEPSQVHNVLFRNLDKLLEKDKSIGKIFDEGYWGNVFHSSLFAYFDNLRNVYRFTSTFSFHFSLFQGSRAFEVNPVDLIAIECLRVFEPEVYKEIAHSKEIFTNNGYGSNSNKSDKTKEIIKAIIAKSSEGKSDYIEKLIKLIFPTIEWALGGSHYSDFSDQWFKAMRICHPSNFDKYFQFSIPTGEISHSELQEMLELTSNREAFKASLLSLSERNTLNDFLSKFRAFIDEMPKINEEPFILAVLDIADMVEHDRISFLMASPNIRLSWLVIDVLRKINSIPERGKVLLSCFENSQGISIIERILLTEEHKREKSESDLLLADEEFTALKMEFVKRLDELSSRLPHELLQHRHLISFLYRWQRWGNSEKVYSWLREQVSKPESCIHLLSAFIRKSSSWGSNDYVAKITKDIPLKSIEDFVSIDEIIEITHVIDASTLNDEDQEVLTLFNNALERRRSGEIEQW